MMALVKRIFIGLVLAIVGLLLLPTINARAATCTTQMNGTWDTTMTWTVCGGGTPLAGDDIVIANGHTITIDANDSNA